MPPEPGGGENENRRKTRTARPHVPGLTPDGFVRYLTACLRAYPDEEFRRLEKITADPALAAWTQDDDYRRQHDGSRGNGALETLPRPLVRSLLPARHDAETRRMLGDAFDACLAGSDAGSGLCSREGGRGLSSPSSSTSSSSASTAVVVQLGTPREDDGAGRRGGRPAPVRRRAYLPVAAMLDTIDDDDGVDEGEGDRDDGPGLTAEELRATAGRTPGVVRADGHSDDSDYFTGRHHQLPDNRRPPSYPPRQQQQQPERRRAGSYQDQRSERRQSGPTVPAAADRQRYAATPSEHRGGRYRPGPGSASTPTLTPTSTSVSTPTAGAVPSHHPAATPQSSTPGPRRASYPAQHTPAPIPPPPVPQAYRPRVPAPSAPPTPTATTRQWLVGQKREVAAAVPGAMARHASDTSVIAAGRNRENNSNGSSTSNGSSSSKNTAAAAAAADRGPTWDEVLNGQKAGGGAGGGAGAADSMGIEAVVAAAMGRRRGARGSV